MLADASYGINTAFRTALTRMGLSYVVGFQSSVHLWPPGAVRSAQGMEQAGSAVDADASRLVEQTSSAEQLAKSLSAYAWRDVACLEVVDNTLHYASPSCAFGPRIDITAR